MDFTMYVVSMVNRVPFAAGARDCLGMKFAIMEAVLALATFMHRYLIVVPCRSQWSYDIELGSISLRAHRFSFELQPGFQPIPAKVNLVQEPENGIQVRIRPRKA